MQLDVVRCRAGLAVGEAPADAANQDCAERPTDAVRRTKRSDVPPAVTLGIRLGFTGKCRF
jgi:hypothetical protein